MLEAIITSKQAALDQDARERLDAVSKTLQEWCSYLEKASVNGQDSYGNRHGTEIKVDQFAPGLVAALSLQRTAVDRIRAQVGEQAILRDQIFKIHADLVREVEALRKQRSEWIEQRELQQRRLINDLSAKLRQHDAKDSTLADVLRRALDLGVQADPTAIGTPAQTTLEQRDGTVVSAAASVNEPQTQLQPQPEIDQVPTAATTPASASSDGVIV